MATLILGKNLVFWAGVMAGSSFFLNFLTAFPPYWFVVLVIALHITLATLGYVFNKWL